jgi:hypothetical protein
MRSSRSLVSIAAISLFAGVGLAAALASFGPESTRQNADAPKQVAPAAHTPASPKALFDAVKLLAGEWEMSDGKQKTLALRTHIFAAGHVVSETMFPGLPHEMVNMYHLDGEKLVCTHYCAAGNQPRMECKPAPAPGNAPAPAQTDKKTDPNAAFSFPMVLEFTFRDCTNLKSPDETYMGALKLTFHSADSITQEWTNYKAGKIDNTHSPKFSFTRKPK